MAIAIVVTAVVACPALVVAALIAAVSAGIRREERQATLTRQAPGRVSLGARRLTGLYVRETVPALVIDRETTLV